MWPMPLMDCWGVLLYILQNIGRTVPASPPPPPHNLFFKNPLLLYSVQIKLLCLLSHSFVCKNLFTFSVTASSGNTARVLDLTVRKDISTFPVNDRLNDNKSSHRDGLVAPRGGLTESGRPNCCVAAHNSQINTRCTSITNQSCWNLLKTGSERQTLQDSLLTEVSWVCFLQIYNVYIIFLVFSFSVYKFN